MKCLFCGKQIAESASSKEKSAQWHKKCVTAFFGTSSIPEIDISEFALNKIAVESASRGYTVPGVQKKLSLHLSDDGGKPRLTLVNYPSGYILKPQTEQFEKLPEAEHLVMSMATATGIRVVPFALLKVGDNYAYITKRVDRFMRNDVTVKLAMEDFCQLDGRLTEDKYKGSYERCGKIISRYSSRPMFDLSEFFMRIVFCFIVGNSDMHLKNFSLIENKPNGGEYELSPAYDLLPVNVILPEDNNQFGLAMNGKLCNARKKDFTAFAENIGVPLGSSEKIIKAVVALKDKYIDMCENSLLSHTMRQKLIELIDRRVNVLKS